MLEQEPWRRLTYDQTVTIRGKVDNGGAISNLIDRIRGPQGVVDFIDIGIGDMRWPTFNVADMAVSTGAFLLAWVLWGDDRAERARAAEGGAVSGSSKAASATAGSQDAP